ncbi:MAG: amidohydrolase family protein, partial [Acidimicrobiales bacterium]
WIFAKVPVKFPGIRIVLSEAGVSWVPMLLERLQRSHRQLETSLVWKAADPHPADLLLRNFRFASIEDPSAFRALDLIGVDNVMVECDYPHQDTTWPQCQRMIRSQLSGLEPSAVRQICFGNAASLFQHPLPPDELVAASASAESRSSNSYS